MRTILSKQLKDAATELEKVYKLKHDEEYHGYAPGHWGFSATWLPYRDNDHYANTSWYIRAIYVILHQRVWAMHYIFGHPRSKFGKIHFNATLELWSEHSPKAMIEAGLLLPENGTH